MSGTQNKFDLAKKIKSKKMWRENKNLDTKYDKYIDLCRLTIILKITTPHKIHLIQPTKAMDYWPVYVIIKKSVADHHQDNKDIS